MKIGLITYHRALNYGAVLQAYALQQVITGMLGKNDECSILDYKCKKIEDMSVAIHKDKRFLKNVLKSPFRVGPLKKKAKAYREFNGKYLKTCPAQRQELTELSRKFDRLITGSDQLWNYRVCGDDDTYFLDFADDPKKKYSYAVSLGMEKCFNENEGRILKNLSDFACVSLREPIGADKIRAVNPRLRTDVDPTLLLDAKSWESTFDLRNSLGKYILVYCVAPPKNIMSVARELSKKKDLPVYILTEKVADKLKYRDCRCVFGKDPVEFLSFIKNAEYVLTTSFHATVFSLKFHKKLYAEVDNLSGHNDRVHNLIDLTGARQCIEDDFLLNDGELSTEQWKAVDKKTKQLSEKSIDYLRTVIQG